ncbi:MAG: hypothetical protein HY721_21005 [Planctomycetes bacterium]|nr:hypothetical protein [Planctomycetota bacterium]
MNFELDDLLDMVDEWKLKVHERLKGLTRMQRRAFWSRIGRQARKMGLRVIEPERPSKRVTKRAPRATG